MEKELRWLPNKIREEARTFYYEKFYKYNDPGHQLDHVDEVYNSLRDYFKNHELNKEFKVDDTILYYAALLHDIFSSKDRKFHHVLAADYVLKRSDFYLEIMSDFEIKTIAKMVYFHRASVEIPTELKNDLLVKAIRIADKGSPVYERILTRIVDCNPISKYTGSFNDKFNALVKHTYQHLNEKFGVGGYLYTDKEYIEFYGKDKIEKLQNTINSKSLKDIEYDILKLN